MPMKHTSVFFCFHAIDFNSIHAQYFSFSIDDESTFYRKILLHISASISIKLGIFGQLVFFYKNNFAFKVHKRDSITTINGGPIKYI